MLSDKSTVCPISLLDVAHQKKGVKAAVVNAGKKLPMLSVMDAVEENLISPVFIGDENEIKKCAEELKFDLSNFEIINETIENNTAKVASQLAADGKVRIIVKGHIHTDVLMKEVFKREYNLIGKTRLSHIWHMTLEKDDKPLIITDGALNVNPNVKTKMHILRNVIDFCWADILETQNTTTASRHEKAPKPNDLYIIPAWLEHAVLPHGNDEFRISITINMSFV